MHKFILILAGANGAGKTTFATEYLPREGHCPQFVNADLIASGLSPFAPEAVQVQAGRIMLQRIRELVKSGESFGFETTLAGKSYARMIPAWRSAGYRIHLFFVKLQSEELAIERVRRRTEQGGHGVPDDIIRRRFRQGWSNFQTLYLPLADEWAVYDNSGPRPVLLEEGRL